MEVKVSYLKRKVWTPIETWVVTTIENKNSILREDSKTKDRLIQAIYGPKYKSQKGIRIDDIISKRQIGFTHRYYDELTDSQKEQLNET